jgi:hypothetical protein
MLSQVPFKSHFSRQISIAYDVYLAVRRITDQRVKTALERDSSDWRLRHCCPVCTYHLKGEKKLSFNILFAMDRNDSLKRVRGGGLMAPDPGGGSPEMRPSNECPDDRTCGEEYFLSSNVVDALGRKLEEARISDDEASSPHHPR